MSLQTPTTQDINASIIAQLEASLSQTITLLPKAFIRVLSKVLAAVFILLYKYSGFVFLQLFIKTATNKETEINGVIVRPLTLWGETIGAGPATPATNAELTIDVTVQNQVGNLPSGSQLVNSANGVTYVTLSVVALDAPIVSATIKASADQTGGNGAGALGNLENGEIVSFANPLPNVARDAVVTGETVTGANEEEVEIYRQRIIDLWQKRPQGGALVDYEIWGGNPSGIVNVFPYRGNNPGEVDVYSEATEASSGSPDGIPTAAQLQAVFDAIELDVNGKASRRPANAFVNSFPITRTGFDVRVFGVTGVPDQVATELDIDEAIQQFFREAEPFIVGLSILPHKDQITRSALTSVVNSIVSAAGGTFTDVAFGETTTLANLDIYILGQGEKAKSVLISFL